MSQQGYSCIYDKHTSSPRLLYQIQHYIDRPQSSQKQSNILNSCRIDVSRHTVHCAGNNQSFDTFQCLSIVCAYVENIVLVNIHNMTQLYVLMAYIISIDNLCISFDIIQCSYCARSYHLNLCIYRFKRIQCRFTADQTKVYKDHPYTAKSAYSGIIIYLHLFTDCFMKTSGILFMY